MNKVQYTGLNTGVGPSPIIWSDCPIAEMYVDPNVGKFYREQGQQILNTTALYWTITPNISGLMGLTTGGGFQIGGAADGASEGPNCQALGIGITPAVGKTIWFEARVKAAQVLDNIVVGLAAANTTILSTASVLDEGGTDDSKICFYHDQNTASGTLEFQVSDADSRDNTAGVKTYAANTYFKIGFKVMTEDGKLVVQPYVDGVPGTKVTDTADIPLVVMYPTLCARAEHTAHAFAAVLTTNWIQIAQLL